MQNTITLDSFPPSRPPDHRTYRPARQRTRLHSTGCVKSPPIGRFVGKEEGEMEKRTEGIAQDVVIDSLIDRATLCLPHLGKDVVVHRGDEGFQEVLRQYFPLAESNASERLVKLKSKLRVASTHDFWGLLMEEMCDIVGAQCGFVAKRMLVDDQDSAVEMPELGEKGSCLMGVAFYINDGADVKQLYNDYRYHAYGTPCAHMKHDKVFIVPEKMTEFIRDNPNETPWKKSEAFIGLPLFAEGKCCAHFGMVWSQEGATKRQLSWSFTEMFMHSLEDIILQRILEGRGFVKEVAPVDSVPAKVIPLAAITASQSLKPYARSLSHELRTPMQGVVGMLDIMYSTVLDAIANQQSDRAKDVFMELKKHIEVVQDSSRRAVEAADNVVHAYDLDMQMPEVSLEPEDSKSEWTYPGSGISSGCPQTPLQTQSDNLTSPPNIKRERSENLDFQLGPSSKRMCRMSEVEILETYYPEELVLRSGGLNVSSRGGLLDHPESKWSCGQEGIHCPAPKPNTFMMPSIRSPLHRQIAMRDFMKGLVSEALRNGHPTSEVHSDTALGEQIEIRTLGPRGEIQDRTIFLEIDSNVPQSITTEEQQLQFALQKLIDNAIKFTERGRITITVKMSNNFKIVEIRIQDTGCGISEDSKSNLFKPHFQEDSSISRSKDGLGLSLFNAKAHVRKNLGGDVTLERSETEGPAKGSVFLVRLPISSLDSDIPRNPVSVPTLPTIKTAEIHMTSEPDPSLEPPLPKSKKASRSSLSKASLRKRQAFNSNLATNYPINILIVEDNAINRNVAVGSLNKLGYRGASITVAFDGLEAVKRYKESLERSPHERFSCVLMDIWMPNMDGYEATTKIMSLARESGDATKIIAVTADITEESLSRATAAGMHGFLAKPYKVLDIEHLIEEHFQPCC